MFAVPRSELPDFRAKEITAEDMRRRGKEARERRAAAEAEGAGDGVTELPLVDGLPAAAVPGDHPFELPVEPKGGEALIGFARIYAGVIKKGSKLFCVSPKYNTALPPNHPANTRHISSVEVTNLYMMMGRELVPVDMVPAGNIFAIAGLEGKVLRNATLCAPGNSEGVDDVMQDGVKDCLVNLAGVVMQVSSG
jgi:ribosome assembly protein 1